MFFKVSTILLDQTVLLQTRFGQAGFSSGDASPDHLPWTIIHIWAESLLPIVTKALIKG